MYRAYVEANIEADHTSVNTLFTLNTSEKDSAKIAMQAILMVLNEIGSLENIIPLKVKILDHRIEVTRIIQDEVWTDAD